MMLVPQTVVGFRATVSALRSLDGSKGAFTFSLPEDRSILLLIKNLDRHMPVEVVREKMESLGICVQEVLQLRSGRE
jgi:hypothetical protein